MCVGSDGESGELVKRGVIAGPRDETGDAEHRWLENDLIVEGGATEVLVLEQGVASITESQYPDGAHGASSPTSVRRGHRAVGRHATVENPTIAG
jgi:hypothetical protein